MWKQVSSVELLLLSNGLTGVLKASEGHLRARNLDRALRADLLSLLTKCATLLGHSRFTRLILRKSLICELIVRLVNGDARHTHAFSVDEALGQRRVVNLLVHWWIFTALSIDVVREQVLTVVDATDRWIYIAFAVGVKSWLAEVSGERGVWEPSRCVQERRLALLHFFGSFLLSSRHLFPLDTGALGCTIV